MKIIYIIGQFVNEKKYLLELSAVEGFGVSPFTKMNIKISIIYVYKGDNMQPSRFVRVFLAAVLMFPVSGLFGQVERWIYGYNGPGNKSEISYGLTCDPTGNIYTGGYVVVDTFAGYSWTDLEVISLTSEGSERWVYQFNGYGNSFDGVRDMVNGADGNIYVTGTTVGYLTDYDIIVINLDTSGNELWKYTYNGPANYSDVPYSIVCDLDGNIYVAGWITMSGEMNQDIAVISLTASGSERWIYTYSGPGNSQDFATSLVYGADKNLYLAGWSYGSGTSYDFTVISLTTDGNERWVYRYNGSANGMDVANSIAYGNDDNIYVAGDCFETGTYSNFAVMSLDTSGNERWFYRFNGTGSADQAWDVIYGSDGNIYSVGYSGDALTSSDFRVVSLTSSGNERWVYRYNGPGNKTDVGYSIIERDGSIYAAGYCSRSGTYPASKDFLVVSLDTSGTERWTYLYNGLADNEDEAKSIICGSNGYIYAAGTSFFDIGKMADIIVINLEDTLQPVTIEENKSQKLKAESKKLEVYPNPFSTMTKINFSTGHVAEDVLLKIYDAAGRLVKSFNNLANYQTTVAWFGDDNSGNKVPPGIYFVRLETRDYEKIVKVMLAR